MLRARRCVWTLAFVALALSASVAQVDGPFPMLVSDADLLATPDQEVGSQTADNPPSSQTSGASINPLPESRSLFMAGIYLSESLESIPGDNQGNSTQVFSFTRALGSLNFLKINRRFETALDYRGGGYFRDGASLGFTQGELQQLQATQRILWSKTALTLSDSLGNFPGGSFGSTWFGGASAYTLGSTSVSAPSVPLIADFIGTSNFVGFGQAALNNISLLELTQSLTRRSSLTLAGAYGFTDYWGNNRNFINSQQISTLVNYGHQLTPRSEIGLIYGYRTFHFPERNAGDIATQVTQVAYLRSLSRRLRMQVGAGPEFSRIITPITVLGLQVNLVTNQINVSASGSLAYRVRATEMALSYDRLVTNGSGVFAGANTDIVQSSVNRQLKRSWEVTFDAGYVRLSRIQRSQALVPGNSYQYGFAGAGIRKKFGQFNLLASYQFNDESFNTSVCQVIQSCNRVSQRHVGLIGIYWHTRPIRLDSGGGQGGEAEPTDGQEPSTNDSHAPRSDN